MPLPRLLPRLLPTARPIPSTRLPLLLRPSSTHVHPPSNRLAKPTKFTPPSHPSRRPVGPTNYPGPPTSTDPTKHYPHTFPPENTTAHFLLTSKRLHFYLSLGILFSLAAASMLMNFLHTDKFGREVNMTIYEPVRSFKDLMEAFRKSAEAESARVKEMRRRKVEEIEKRGEYRRAHGLEQVGEEGGFGGWGVKRKEEDGRERGEAIVRELRAEQAEAEIRKLEEEAGVRTE